jgi:hypothetical protein
MNWESKIVGHAKVDPKSLTAHPLNFRTHPEAQKAALRGSISEVGFIRSVTVNKRTGRIVDGHERVEEAIASGQPEIDVEYVDLSEEDEKKALAFLDPISAMAGEDAGKLDELLSGIEVEDTALQSMLDDLAPPVLDEETTLKQIDTQPPPKMTWVLIGIPTVRFGEISEPVEQLAQIPEIIIESTSNNG